MALKIMRNFELCLEDDTDNFNCLSIRRCGPVVTTSDSDSDYPSSNLGTASFFILDPKRSYRETGKRDPFLLLIRLFISAIVHRRILQCKRTDSRRYIRIREFSMVSKKT